MKPSALQSMWSGLPMSPKASRLLALAATDAAGEVHEATAGQLGIARIPRCPPRAWQERRRRRDTRQPGEISAVQFHACSLSSSPHGSQDPFMNRKARTGPTDTRVHRAWGKRNARRGSKVPFLTIPKDFNLLNPSRGKTGCPGKRVELLKCLNGVAIEGTGRPPMNEIDLNRYLKEIINTMNDGVLLVSPQGTILMVNQAMETISGYSREELIGRSCSTFHCDVCERVRSEGRGHWCELFKGGESHRKSCFIVRKDGSCVHVLKNASLLRDGNGGVLGAVETVTDISEIDRRDQRINELSRQLEEQPSFLGLVGISPVMRNVFEIIEKASQSEAPLIIFGETGTGKELVAHAIHRLGKRRDGPFIQLNCAALNESLLESELFGHVKGAFTGAYGHRQGRFEAADGGDIFLDEIGDLPLNIQVKLLRTLETKQIERVGDHRPIRVDARIITATNRNLDRLVAEGRFREDFYFRINVIPIHLPRLRKRPEDIPSLADHFIRRLRLNSGKDITGLSAEAMELFTAHRWPGNVRELKGALEYAFVVAEKGLLQPKHLPATIRAPSPARSARAPRATSDSEEKTALVDALLQCRGNQTHAARLLGVNRVTVWHRIKKYGIEIDELLRA